MAKGIFFMSWELWQQMTFTLAVMIVAVFCAGLVKLWWTNRIVRKQEILDEEKKARLDDMRSTGLRHTSSKRAAASMIPFGVRAIQSGVQVDGIWISKPATSTGTKPTLTDSESLESVSSGAIPPPLSRNQRHDHLRRHGLRAPHALNEVTLRRLEGQDGGAQSPQRPAVFDIYVPTTNSQGQEEARDRHMGGPTRGSQRSTGSRSGDSSSDSAHHWSPRSGGGGEERLYEPRGAERRDAAVGDPLGTLALQVTYQQQQQQQMEEDAELMMIPAPEPTLGPGDLHFMNNRSAARRVNDGFMVLPVGRLETPGIEHRMNHDHLNSLQGGRED